MKHVRLRLNFPCEIPCLSLSVINRDVRMAMQKVLLAWHANVFSLEIILGDRDYDQLDIGTLWPPNSFKMIHPCVAKRTCMFRPQTEKGNEPKLAAKGKAASGNYSNGNIYHNNPRMEIRASQVAVPNTPMSSNDHTASWCTIFF